MQEDDSFSEAKKQLFSALSSADWFTTENVSMEAWNLYNQSKLGEGKWCYTNELTTILCYSNCYKGEHIAIMKNEN